VADGHRRASLPMRNNTQAAFHMLPLLSQLYVFRFTFGSVSAYNGSVFMTVLKFLYVLLFVILVYLNIAFTAIVSFLKVSFFGL